MTLSVLGPPIDVRPLLVDEREELLHLLAALPAAAWTLPTPCPGWRVHDLVAHLLGDDLGLLARLRDGWSLRTPTVGEPFPAFIHRLNAEWVTATRRLSPLILQELLRHTGAETNAFFASRNPLALGEPVSWAGAGPAPHWLGAAREYTERWVHHQQIRLAVGASELTEPHFFAPVLDTFARALPFTFRDTAAPIETTFTVQVDGPAGGTWSLLRQPTGWVLVMGAVAHPAASVRLHQDVAWRLCTGALREQDVHASLQVTGDSHLAAPIATWRAIIL